MTTHDGLPEELYPFVDAEVVQRCSLFQIRAAEIQLITAIRVEMEAVIGDVVQPFYAELDR